MRGTRPVAAGQWDDVERAEVERDGFVITLRLLLTGGKTFTAHDDAPGWDDLIEHGADVLSGFPSVRAIADALDGATGPVTIYTRSA